MSSTSGRCFSYRPWPESRVGVFAKRYICITDVVMEESAAFILEGERPSPIEIVQKFRSLPQPQKTLYTNQPNLGLTRCREKELEELSEIPVPHDNWFTRRRGEEGREKEPAPENRLQLYEQILARTNWDDTTQQIKIIYLSPQISSMQVAVFWRIYFVMGDSNQKGIFLHAGRLAHSCLPNCYASWDPDREKLCVYPVRSILKGEELTICYDINDILLRSRDDRNRILHEEYGFECTCPACDLSTEFGRRSEYNRRAIKEGMAQVGCNASNDSKIELYKNLLKLMETEGLVFFEKAELHWNLALLYEDNKDYGKAKSEAANAVRIARICLGDGHRNARTLYDEFERLKAAAVRYEPLDGW